MIDIKVPEEKETFDLYDVLETKYIHMRRELNEYDRSFDSFKMELLSDISLTLAGIYDFLRNR